jgi:hypothetical protein
MTSFRRHPAAFRRSNRDIRLRFALFWGIPAKMSTRGFSNSRWLPDFSAPDGEEMPRAWNAAAKNGNSGVSYLYVAKTEWAQPPG